MENKSKLLTIVAVFGSLGASICCIGPFIALAIGGSSFASIFSWATPLRPILIGLTIMVLIYAWQRKLKRSKQTDCDCKTQAKLRFVDTKLFLGILTGVSILFLTFPYYSALLSSEAGKKLHTSSNPNETIVKFHVSGMTCESCATLIKNSLKNKEGVQNVTVLLAENTVIVTFNRQNLTSKQISEYLDGMGYAVLSSTSGQN
jgi:copper chaperone CopZ